MRDLKDIEQSFSEGGDCPSNLILDQLRLDELPQAQLTSVRQHLADCAGCAARLERFEAEYAGFEDQVFVAGHAARVRRAAGGSSAQKPRRAAYWVGGLVAAAAAALIVLRPPAPEPAGVGGVEPSHQIRIKGADKLELVVRHPDGKQESVLPGGKLTEGDAIRFEVTPSRASHLVIVGLDSSSQVEGASAAQRAGAVAIYVPADGAAPPQLTAGEKFVPEGSVVLDAAVGDELIFAVLCDAPMASEAIGAAARSALDKAGGAPGKVEGLSVDCRQASFRFRKAQAPTP